MDLDQERPVPRAEGSRVVGVHGEGGGGRFVCASGPFSSHGPRKGPTRRGHERRHLIMCNRGWATCLFRPRLRLVEQTLALYTHQRGVWGGGGDEDGQKGGPKLKETQRSLWGRHKVVGK